MTDPCSPEHLRGARKTIEESAFGEFSDRLENLRSMVDSMNEVFGKFGFKLDSGFETFTDNTGSVFDLSKLRSNIHMKRYTMISDDDKGYISSMSNDLQNTYIYLKKKISPQAFDWVMQEIAYRCENRSNFITRYGDTASKITGKHQSKISPNFYYDFSNNPEDIFRKSTGQTWSPHNCERYGGISEKGIFSDIEHNSVVVFLKKVRSRKFYGRLMLRVCVYGHTLAKNPAPRPKKLVDELGYEFYSESIEVPLVSFGYDKYWYRGYDSHERFTVNQNKRFDDNEMLTAKSATAEVLQILKDAGMNLDYKECTTPYTHEGYSDVEQRKETSITYSPVYSQCPECGEIVPVDRNGRPRCNNCGQRYTCRNCGRSLKRGEMAEGLRICISCQEEENEGEDEESEEERQSEIDTHIRRQEEARARAALRAREARERATRQ